MLNFMRYLRETKGREEKTLFRSFQNRYTRVFVISFLLPSIELILFTYLLNMLQLKMIRKLNKTDG